MKDINLESAYIEQINETQNLPDSYSVLTDPNYNRQETQDKIYEQINNTDWKAESDYFNYTRVNGKNIQGRTIKCSNKEYLKRIQHDKTNI